MPVQLWEFQFNRSWPGCCDYCCCAWCKGITALPNTVHLTLYQLSPGSDPCIDGAVIPLVRNPNADCTVWKQGADLNLPCGAGTTRLYNFQFSCPLTGVSLNTLTGQRDTVVLGHVSGVGQGAPGGIATFPISCQPLSIAYDNLLWCPAGGGPATPTFRGVLTA